MYEFKLNYYFEILKDEAFDSRKIFKEKFIKKYGKFEYLKELIIMVENYQINKFGILLSSDNYRKNREEYSRIVIASNKRERYRRKNEKKNI